MNYKIVESLLYPETSEKNCPVYNVIETQTEQVVKSFDSKDKAKKFLRHLNLGGGFDGWTPTFFLNKLNINNSFV